MQKPPNQPGKSQLDSDRIGRLLVKMAMPVFIGMFIQASYNVVNTIFIGHFVGTEAIAGLSIVFPMQMMGIGLGVMVGIGGLSIISRSIGAGDIARAERALGNSFTASVAVSVGLMVIILPFADFWLRLIGASDEVFPYAHTYLTIIISGTIFNTMAVSVFSLVRAEGNTRVGMTAMVLGALLNIALDAILIIWLRMGVTGAALGTVIAQAATTFYLLSYYLSGKSYLKLRPANFTPDFKILRSMFAVGVSSFVQTVGTSISMMVLLHSVIAYGGDIILSALGVTQRVMMFANLPALVIGQGLQPILGFNYGARRFGLGLKAIYLAYASSTVLSILTFTLVFVFPGQITSIFTTDPELIEAGIYTMRMALLALPLIGLIMVSQMIFQAIGNATKSFITSISRPVVFLIPAVLLLSHWLQLHGALLALPTADVLTFLLIIVLMIPVLNELRRASAREKRENAALLTSAPPAG